jgi:hypothetical protein
MGDRLLTASFDGTARIWNWDASALLHNKSLSSHFVMSYKEEGQ